MRKDKSKRNNKLILIIALIIIILALVGILILKNHSSNNIDNNTLATSEQENSVDNVPEEKVDIIDVNSKTRPYAVAVNNTAVAVKVQEGLNKAYLVYEIPKEGNTSRLLALYKDVKE